MMMMVASMLIKVTVLIAAVLVGTRLARNSCAAVRHLLLAVAFAVLLILPAASIIAPPIRVALPIALHEAIEPLDEPTTDVTPSGQSTSSPAVAPPARASESWSRWSSVSALLIDGWIAGAVVFLLPVAVGLWEVRALRRSSLPWPDGSSLVGSLARDAGIHRRIDVLLHESLPGPMTCGVLYPAIILPVDAPTWREEDLRRAIVHELEHVMRRDWLSQALARVVVAGYWFHPIVWVAWRQLTLEAERACDDAVLRRSEATAYADQLVLLARRLSRATSHPQLAMASRADLATRVVAVLDDRQRRGRVGAVVVGVVCAAAALLVAAISPVWIVAEQAQADKPAAAERFDAASVKPCKPEDDPRAGRGRGGAGGTNATFSPGRMNVPCVTLEQLIYLAYAGSGAREDERLVNDSPGRGSDVTKVRGGPAWVHSDREGYAVEATAQGAADRTVLLGTMLRTLLEDRFHLKIHRESEEVPMYALTVARGGFRLKPMKAGECDADRSRPPDPTAAMSPCGFMNSRANGPNAMWTFVGFGVRTLAARLSGTVGRHVIDRTGITDEFIIRLEFHPDEATPGITWVDQDESVPRAGSIFTALEQQLGLKLEPTRGPREFIVIDHVQRPTPN